MNLINLIKTTYKERVPLYKGCYENKNKSD